MRYDGCYRIVRAYRKPGTQGQLVCRYLFVRADNEPAPWSSEGGPPRPIWGVCVIAMHADIFRWGPQAGAPKPVMCVCSTASLNRSAGYAKKMLLLFFAFETICFKCSCQSVLEESGVEPLGMGSRRRAELCATWCE